MRSIVKGFGVIVVSWVGLFLGREIVMQGRLSALPGGAATGLALTLLTAAGAYWAVLAPNRRLTSRAMAALPLLAITIRWFSPQLSAPASIVTGRAATAQALLRFIASAQEEYRLQTGRYTSSLDDLRGIPTEVSNGQTVILTSKDDRWWQGIVRYQGGECGIHVGYPEDGMSAEGNAEGVPICDKSATRSVHQKISGARFSGQPKPYGTMLDTTGSWPQHRANSMRSGSTGETAESGHRWDAWVSGELRASASIAGQQVFVGAHGNGEVAALDLRTGRLLWRARAPNWIHHEPVISGRYLAYGFGNNEGTPPNGFDLRDRQSGKLIWRRFTLSTAMGAPLFTHRLLIGTDSGDGVYAWNESDGAIAWRTRVPRLAGAPMSNLLVRDSVLVQTYEQTGWCIIRTKDGTVINCSSIRASGSGGGHSSAALRDSILVLSGASNPWKGWRNHILGKRTVQTDSSISSTISVVGVTVPTGRKAWRSKLEGIGAPVAGHLAGTPVIADSFAFIPLPSIGEVVSVRVSSGDLVWRRRVFPARGSVAAIENKIFVATSRETWVVLDAQSGDKICESRLPSHVDRAPLSVSGSTGVLTFLSGRVTAAPIEDWLACRVTW